MGPQGHCSSRGTVGWGWGWRAKNSLARVGGVGVEKAHTWGWGYQLRFPSPGAVLQTHTDVLSFIDPAIFCWI